jgi:subtilisin family serine protease
MTTTSPGPHYSAGTVEDGARHTALFTAEGLKSGHGTGTIAWLPAPAYEMPSVSWQPPQRPPVIALLDSGVQRHDWLPQGGDVSFVVNAASKYQWPAPALDQPAPPPGVATPFYGSHYGHATFIAGLIRRQAPEAQVLSMPVMNNAGQVSPGHVVKALTWLAKHPETDVRIVLMCFGRPADPGDADLKGLRKAVTALSGMRIVCSAGNDGSDHTVYPAALAAENHPHVASVGAFTTPTERAPYSNYGPWVREWRKGTNLVSTMPLTTTDIGKNREEEQAASGAPDVSATGNGFAWWSGTSFAAALYAAELAKQMSAG